MKIIIQNESGTFELNTETLYYFFIEDDLPYEPIKGKITKLQNEILFLQDGTQIDSKLIFKALPLTN
ncbi:hypothetical protein bcgnr5378_29700 [Bacillus cereus]|uniref:Uncharacterized protein n=1 Tax=Bacillus cereus TaxID=1396 RepID=A0A164QT15_BACCE|nr:hypothetical protein [Bacillus cereus]KZD72143.1 hypothetical protein B4088_0604 [Bacillus cereus]